MEMVFKATMKQKRVPPTLLLLMLINKFADYNPLIIQCQFKF